MIKVVKFGGSSVANSAQFRKVKAIVEADPSRKFIVASACGKESGEDHKVTDLLYLCEAHIRYGVSYDSIFSMIEDKYLKIRDDLGLKTDLESEFRDIRAKMDSKEISRDFLVSRGEYLTCRLLAEYLSAEFVDAADVIRFDFSGQVDLARTHDCILRRCSTTDKVVIPGFYGSLPNGIIKVMARGGSDITGSVIANVVDADVYENWTDVSGFMVADPRIVDHPASIPYITYSELREMSYMGASVLADEAVFPVRDKNIPINIRNTNDPDHPGTMILNDCSEWDKTNPPGPVTGIAGRRNFTVITLDKSHCSTAVGYLRRLLSIFEDFRISVEAVPVTVDTSSVIVSSSQLEECRYELLNRINSEIEPDGLTVEDNVALLAVVGRGMKALPGSSGNFLSEFGRHHINIKLISQSSDEHSVLVGVDNHDFEAAIRCIYERFLEAK